MTKPTDLSKLRDVASYLYEYPSQQKIVSEAADTIDTQAAEIARLNARVGDAKPDLVPGKLCCARCKFTLLRNVLHMPSGSIGAGTNETEPCPNGCGPLWPITWEQEAHDCYKLMEEFLNRAVKAEGALAAIDPKPAKAAEPVGMPDMSDDMLSPEQMQRNVRERKSERAEPVALSDEQIGEISRAHREPSGLLLKDISFARAIIEANTRVAAEPDKEI